MRRWIFVALVWLGLPLGGLLAAEQTPGNKAGIEIMSPHYQSNRAGEASTIPDGDVDS